MYHSGKPFLSKNSALKPLLTQEFHSTLLGGHAGIQKNTAPLNNNVFWDGMRQDVVDFVSSCSTCQQTKYLPQPGLLQPITPAAAVWEDLAMDFITGLPAFQGQTVIMVAVDRFSKQCVSTYYLATSPLAELLNYSLR